MKPFSKKNKIILIILLLVICQNISLAQGTWERLNSPTTENLSSVYFVDSSYGWAAGHSGMIIHTSNGGDDWIIQDSKTENNIFDIFFLNRNLGWVVSWEAFNYPFGTYVLKTTDGGLNWNSSTFPEENIFSQCILFLDSLNGWMGGKPYPIVRTTDGGISWVQPEIDSTDFSDLPVYDIQFYNSRFGFASGGRFDCCGIMWWTTNGGDYWFVADTPNVAPEPIYQIHIFDTSNVLGVGGDADEIGLGAGVIRTSNGGETWKYEYLGIFGIAWDIDFRTDYEAWAPLGGEQKLIYSLDAGSTWTPISTPDSAMIIKMVFPDSLHGFGVGMEGAIIKYKPDISSINEKTDFIPERIVLHQNYPNPFNPTTKIKFDVPAVRTHDRVTVQLRVYDILGSEVATLVNEELAAGSYEINFSAKGGSASGGDAYNLPSGVYFYILFAEEYVCTKKMILLR